MFAPINFSAERASSIYPDTVLFWAKRHKEKIKKMKNKKCRIFKL
jgi:hypothetical protein